jgi:hypothetical protein
MSVEPLVEGAAISRSRKPLRHSGRVLADALAVNGIRHVFTVPGESFLDTLDGLSVAASA